MQKSMLVKVLMCFAIACNASPFSQQTQESFEAWEAFQKTYAKSYATKSESYKREIQFIASYRSIQRHNAKFSKSRSLYEAGVNKFADLSNHEFLRYYTGLKEPTDSTKNENILTTLPDNLKTPPANFDWRSVPNVLTTVKKQGRCGSCWAFAAIVTLEAAYNIKQGYLAGNFSEQFLVDCDGRANGCSGGWPTSAFNYVKRKGIATEESYPYTATDGTCQPKMASLEYSSFTMTLMNDVSDSDLQSIIYNYGPVAVAIDGLPLKKYKSGILDTDSCDTMNHLINIVGYVTSGEGAPYYIARNSWGPNWADKGYFNISAVNSCLIKNRVWYVTYN